MCRKLCAERSTVWGGTYGRGKSSPVTNSDSRVVDSLSRKTYCEPSSRTIGPCNTEQQRKQQRKHHHRQQGRPTQLVSLSIHCISCFLSKAISSTSITMSDSLHYPNLTPCRVVVNGSSGSNQPPVRLPAACLAAAREPELSAMYDFALGKVTQSLSLCMAQIFVWKISQ